MDLKLNDKTALVTGSTAGIGYAIAKSLANEGATVYVNGRNQTKVDEVVKKLITETGNHKIKGIAADFSNIAQVGALTAQLPEVDILVNNVGIFEPKPFTEITDADWLKFFEVNVLSGVRLSRAYFDKMISKNWGRIIFISSESAYQIPEEMIHYGTTKTAQIAVARGLAELTKSTGVTVNTVLPGPTLSEGVGDFIEALAKDQGLSNTEVEKDFFTNVRGTSLIKRFITTEEIANMVTYIASPLSAATNGATLRADGGVIKTAF
ncbi:SDR family NAD(P)-dependent oxidoreductase [Mucilaginibacter sp. P25]|uniref:NAD(P)-dependent dehydrogenase, short-chain alcohol dehydrogenase family n=1 Tax=Mucilaginibacter gossypii TaxID=551996 RepID=A0A1G7UD28_9SPHI|nr:SDR family oxidoreductase [Mucilaginibacter gossypii]SDG45492.1 NAD(P)-dependent dehydrogenase, short-chain alcohol dehydrogenase family [Mucilaginibacter gossypii]